MNNENRPAVLITGAGGALAKKTIAAIKSRYDVVAVDFREKVDLGQDVASYRVDVNKRGFEDIFRKHPVGRMIHLGRIGPDVSDRFSRYNTNVLGTQRLLELCRKYGVKKAVVLSTYFVYGANAHNPALLDEDTPQKAAELSRELIDAVELDNLSMIHLWKYPDLNMTLLRPCNIAGPGIRNNLSLLMASRVAPVMAGYSPMMQFIHVDDMVRALILAVEKNHPGIYNVAPDDWIAYQEALDRCGCVRLPLPSIPPFLPRRIARIFKFRAMPSYLINYMKYPVVIDSRLFNQTFGFQTEKSMEEIFGYYREKKRILDFEKKKFL